MSDGTRGRTSGRTAESRRAVVLVNIGTPRSFDPEDVGEYLRQFLMDKDVIPLPFVFRWLLVHLLIVPRRKKTSAALYRKIWMDEGSPLMVFSRRLQAEMSKHLDGSEKVEIAMRYGEPSIERVLAENRDCGELVVVPMFPQFAEATSGSMAKECRRVAARLGIEERLKILPEFHSDGDYIRSLSESIQKHPHGYDHLLFSYHGLPEKQIFQGDRSAAHCLKRNDCCEKIAGLSAKCYRAQCFATTRAVAGKLDLPKDRYTVSFQSRLGRAEWIRPYTDETVRALAEKGVKRLAVVCPAFLIDCLETLEEVAIGMKEVFIESGGEELSLIPCLNADPEWSRRFTDWIHKRV